MHIYKLKNLEIITSLVKVNIQILKLNLSHIQKM